MYRSMLKGKIHRATVTGADLHYEGSITIDPVLLEAADILPYEEVWIYNIANGERFQTYVIPGTPGDGEICLNGAAAHKVSPGDLVIICAYAQVPEEQVAAWKPRLVYVDAANRPVHQQAA